MSNLVILSTEKSSYFSNLILDNLSARPDVHLDKLEVIRSTFPGGERYYRLDVKDNFELLGKVAIYVCALTDDDDILEVIRVGQTLVQLGVRRRIFIIPFLAYSTMERAVNPGEVVTGKVTIQMLSSIGNGSNGNVFLLYDLHTPGLLHYFEGSSIRLELSGHEPLLKSLHMLGFKQEEFMFASADLGRTTQVNAFARETGTGVAFIRKVRSQDVNGNPTTNAYEVIGNVAGKHVVIYDDMTRSGTTLILAAEKYLSSGAKHVSVMITHFLPNDDKCIQRLIDSRFKKIVMINTHPGSQLEMVQKNERFVVIDCSHQFVECLKEIIPKS